MAIRVVTGVPGSGKTYWVVKHLADKYCSLEGGQYRLKGNYLIVTNIDSLTLPHKSLDDCLAEVPLEKFFTVEYQKEFVQGYEGVLYVIDEAQRYFHRRFYNKDVFFFFQYHRHLGIDIYLVTQDFRVLPRELRSLAEFEIKAHRRTTSLLGEFRYSICVAGDTVDRKVFKPDKRIFALYRSMVADEVEKPKRTPMWKYVAVVAVFLVLSVGLFYRSFIAPYRHVSTHSPYGFVKGGPVATAQPSTAPASASSPASAPADSSSSPPAGPFAPAPALPQVPQEAVTKKIYVYCSFSVNHTCLLYTDARGVNYKPSVVNGNDNFVVTSGLFVWMSHAPSPASDNGRGTPESKTEEVSINPIPERVCSYRQTWSGDWVVECEE